MGIDISGRMILGAPADEVCFDEDESEFDDIYEWADENDMIYMSENYDCGSDEQFVGFGIEDVEIDEIDEWVVNVKKLSVKFKELTGIDAKLVGMQNVW